MSTKRRVGEKKPAEPPLPKRNPNEKLIQAETTEVGTVPCDFPFLSLLSFSFWEKKIYVFYLFIYLYI